MTARSPVPLVLEAGDARLTVSPEDGGRMTSLVVDGDELLVTEGEGPIRWGCYPMAPFAGRIRDGRFTFRGREVRLPLNLGPNAIHGTVFTRPWTAIGPDRMTVDLGPDWPFPGRIEQVFHLDPGGLDVEMRLEAEAPMPASIGWHPWFRRRLAGTAARSRPDSDEAVLDVESPTMFERGLDGLPTGNLVRPGAGPWDDCFTDFAAPPRVIWPGRRALELHASTAYWVIYDAEPHAVCVEPQTAPPDIVNIAPAAGQDPPIAEPGAPLVATMRWDWAGDPLPARAAG